MQGMSEVNTERSIDVDPNSLQSAEGLSSKNNYKYKCLHLLYWIIIALAIWAVGELSKQQAEIQERLSEDKAREQQSEGKIKSLQHQNELLKMKEEEVQADMRVSALQANYLFKQAIQQHYLKKIENIRQLAQTQTFLRENQRAKTSYLLSMNNIQSIHENIHNKREINSLLAKEYERLSKAHDFSLPEKPFCLVVPTINNAKDFRYYYNLVSIFNLNYTNYNVVIIDDASTDDNYELIQQYLKEHPVQQKVILVKNQKRMLAIANIYKAATEYCDPHDILVLVDGDDQLLGVNVLKVVNSAYTINGLYVMYTNFIVSRRGSELQRGFSSGYSEKEKKEQRYRDGHTRMFPLRTFNVSTFLKIDPSQLKDDDGNWFPSAYDETICPQVLQLSCGKNLYLEEYFYLYNFGIGNNDIEINPNLNREISKVVRSRKRYQCPSL